MRACLRACVRSDLACVLHQGDLDCVQDDGGSDYVVEVGDL